MVRNFASVLLLYNFFLYLYATCRIIYHKFSSHSKYLSLWKQFDHSFTDLFGLHSIDNWIQGGGQQQVEIGYKNVNVVRYGASPKTMREEVEEGWDIGDDNSTDVWCAGAGGFVASICRWQTHYGTDNHGVRHEDTEHIESSNQYGNYETVDGINLDVAAGQFGHRHVVTVGVVDEVAPAVGKTLDQESKWDHEQHTSTEGGKPNLGNYSVGEDGRIA